MLIVREDSAMATGRVSRPVGCASAVRAETTSLVLHPPAVHTSEWNLYTVNGCSMETWNETLAVWDSGTAEWIRIPSLYSRYSVSIPFGTIGGLTRAPSETEVTF